MQREILEEERRLWGLRGLPPVDPWTVEKELREYAEADAIAIPSSFVRRSFLAQGVPATKLLQVPYGVDLREFRPLPRTSTGFRAIYAGALSLRKGIPYLMEAAARAQVELWLVGARSAEVEPFLRRHAGRFEYKGSVPQSRLVELYGEADVFVIASLEEGLAMVIPQALASGLPVICTDHSGGVSPKHLPRTCPSSPTASPSRHRRSPLLLPPAPRRPGRPAPLPPTHG